MIPATSRGNMVLSIDNDIHLFFTVILTENNKKMKIHRQVINMSVYHGSSSKFIVAKPSKTARYATKNGVRTVHYSGISLHGTPHEWIALSYTSIKGKSYVRDGEKRFFGVGVSLFNNNKTVYIRGTNSLEYSLEKLYGNGGCVYTFDSDHFEHVKGLGPLEVLSYEEQIPKKIRFVANPVAKMISMGVKFVFEDR
jgi:hypothetical protein